MPQETVGYVELEWTCTRCGTRNPGTTKICTQCGAPMEERQGFEAPAQQTLITDDDKLNQAKTGPDIICPYCGTRNAFGSTKCTQCGGDFTGAKSLEIGRVIGALDTAAQPDVKCLVCGTMNPAANVKCAKCGAPLPKVQPTRAPAPSPAAAPTPAAAGNPGMILIIGAVLVIGCVVGALLLLGGSRTTDSVGAVQSTSWERSIQILAPVPVTFSGWQDDIPASARVGACEQRVRRTQDEPAPNAQKVCGTAYLVDQGNGTAASVQDCAYRVYEAHCEYSALQLAPVNMVTSRGEGESPDWPATNLTGQQELGQRIERYRVVFENDGKLYDYATNDPREYAQFTDGSRWKLKVNDSGQVVRVEGRE